MTTEIPIISISAGDLLKLNLKSLCGRLSAGLVHAGNNILSGIMTQLDLASYAKSEVELREQLNAVLNSCDEGSKLLRHFQRFITTMEGPDGVMDAADIFESALVTLNRVHRRHHTHWLNRTQDKLLYINNCAAYAQAVYHLCSATLETRSEQKSDVMIEGEVERRGDIVELTLSYPVKEPPFELISEAGFSLAAPSGTAYHFWIIDLFKHRLAQEDPQFDSDAIIYKADFTKGILTLKWPYAAKN
ncbi:MAG: hypothetical protein FJY65_09710 [Calditrichaeota bacterium]|nr:hypothetical protein [Calditrichota bacterium]